MAGGQTSRQGLCFVKCSYQKRIGVLVALNGFLYMRGRTGTVGLAFEILGEGKGMDMDGFWGFY